MSAQTLPDAIQREGSKALEMIIYFDLAIPHTHTQKSVLKKSNVPRFSYEMSVEAFCTIKTENNINIKLSANLKKWHKLYHEIQHSHLK